MKRGNTAIISAVVGLAFACLILLACAPAKTVYVDSTVYVTGAIPSTTQATRATMTVTLTQYATTTVQGVPMTITIRPLVYTPVFDRPAPEIPHTYILHLEHSGIDLYDDGVPICFLCHLMPFEHELWQNDAEICETCHKESANPTITPK